MDRGAARSRKRAQKLEGVAQGSTVPDGITPPAQQTHGGRPHDLADRPAYPHPRQLSKPTRMPPRGPNKRTQAQARHNDQSNVNRFKPKAIRSSAALIYSETRFPLPPTRELMENVTRLDMSGSGAEDVSWLEGTKVTWLSLAGCEVKRGWEAVGALKDLSVLNISGCGLSSLPSDLANLSKLKALVAMNNPWSTLSNQVISSWSELNSLIISHSPNLNALPQDLTSLHHLAKLTFSHCPRLTATSLPDLSTLPLLRDVKMNNLPLLTTLPNHITSWGTGDLSLVSNKDEAKRSTNSAAGPSVSASRAQTQNRNGVGLEVLDLGNCSLPYTSISIFLPPPSSSTFSSATASRTSHPTFPHLRSLSLHSNPLASSHPTYPAVLAASPNLPNLQIIDTKRVKERRRKGEVQEGRGEKKARERMEKRGKGRGTGENRTEGDGEMRQWGGAKEADGVGGREEQGDQMAVEEQERRVEDNPKINRKRKDLQDVDPPTRRDDRPKKPKQEHHLDTHPQTLNPTPAAPPAPTIKPSQPKPRPKASKSETSVVQVIDVIPPSTSSKAPKKSKTKHGVKEVGAGDGDGAGAGSGSGTGGAKSRGGVDLKAVFARKKLIQKGEDDAEGDGEGLGLGVGGW